MHHGVAVHFHLAGSINAETDIPLVPPLKHHNFRVFWLNNKEMFFTQKSELILQEICRKGMEREDSAEPLAPGTYDLITVRLKNYYSIAPYENNPMKMV